MVVIAMSQDGNITFLVEQAGVVAPVRGSFTGKLFYVRVCDLGSIQDHGDSAGFNDDLLLVSVTNRFQVPCFAATTP